MKNHQNLITFIVSLCQLTVKHLQKW